MTSSSHAASRSGTRRTCSPATRPRSGSGRGRTNSSKSCARYATVPVINMLTARHHPCQAIADLLTLRESVRCGEGTDARLRRRRQQRRPLAGDPRRIGRRRGADRLAARLRARADRRGGSERRSPRGGERCRRAVYRRVGQHERRSADGQRAPAGAGAIPARRTAARARLAERDRAALPARPPRRGDHRGGPVRAPPAHLGPGRKPPPRAEGIARDCSWPGREARAVRSRQADPRRRRRCPHRDTSSGRSGATGSRKQAPRSAARLVQVDVVQPGKPERRTSGSSSRTRSSSPSIWC